MIISNEKEYALNCLENGIVDKNPYQVISILAKYYWHNGLKKKQIIDNLLDYLKKYYPRYELNEEQWLSEIEKVTEQAYRKKLFEISGVKITKPEINRIKSIKNKTLEKLAFTSLCIAKLNNLKSSNNNGWVNTDTGDIFKMAHISCSVFEQDVKLNKLYVLGMVDFPKANGNLNYRVTFIDNESEEEFFITDFRELGFEYLNYLGENFIRCAECRKLEKPNPDAKNQKYCKIHSKKENQVKKTIFCEDCGKPVEVSAKDNQSNRCPECYEVYRKNRKLETQRIRRNSTK